MLDARQERTMKQSFDWYLVATYLILIVIGLVNIYATEHPSGASLSDMFSFSLRSGKQVVWIATALGLAGIILFVFSARLWEGISLPIYLFVVLLLVAVIFLGVEVKGSRSWFEFGPIRFQPAEISKISTALLLSSVMAKVGFQMSKWKDFLTVLAVIGGPMLIILAEKETGSALVYLGFLFVMYREGLSGWLLVIAGAAIALFITTLTMSPYASLLMLIGFITFGNTLKNGSLWKWILTWGVGIVAFAMLPWLWGMVVDEVVCGVAFGSISKWWLWVASVKPFHILLALSLIALPIVAWKAFMEKATFRLISAGVFIGGLLLIYSTEIIFNKVLQPHQRDRIEVLLGMKEDPSGVGYNVAQSMIAIGSGGFDGKGYMQGTQTAFGFVPEQSTDFIFCTVGEEWGFLGSLLVIGLYVFMILRIILDAEKSREAFTRIYGYCVAAAIFMHLFINIGMTVGLMPVIGIPLPLLSYGGSSLWAFTIMLFIFIALDHEEKKYF
ncbi:MAG: rod shape-determining protein RodA [Bacteroidales bacterium]|nr:rod shape-determining protein RodA [Bacteroidales bacterium]